MNSAQELWWRQASSDYSILAILREQGAVPCHQLHYLQMATEKLGKAYFWGTGKPPAKSHASFVTFLRAVGTVPKAKREIVRQAFGFGRFRDLQNWIPIIQPLVYELERLAPALAQSGPNPEYPWPPEVPQYAPATFKFAIWQEITESGHGRQLLSVIERAMNNFALYC